MTCVSRGDCGSARCRAGWSCHRRLRRVGSGRGRGCGGARRGDGRDREGGGAFGRGRQAFRAGDACRRQDRPDVAGPGARGDGRGQGPVRPPRRAGQRRRRVRMGKDRRRRSAQLAKDVRRQSDDGGQCGAGGVALSVGERRRANCQRRRVGGDEGWRRNGPLRREQGGRSPLHREPRRRAQGARRDGQRRAAVDHRHAGQPGRHARRRFQPLGRAGRSRRRDPVPRFARGGAITGALLPVTGGL